MANKQNFTPLEWTKVLESGMLASMAVTAAEPSGLWGTLMETFGLVVRHLQPRSMTRAQTNSSNRSSPTSKQWKVEEPYRKPWARVLPVPRTASARLSAARG